MCPRAALKQVTGDVPPPEAKPTYATLHATVVFINPDQVGCFAFKS